MTENPDHDKKGLVFGSRILLDATPEDGDSNYWRSLFYFNIYRVSLAIFLLTAGLSNVNVGSLGSRHPELFTSASLVYLALATLFMFTIHNGWPRYLLQTWLQLYLDILFAVLFIYTSGGLGSGLVVLLVITIAASGVLLGGRHAVAAAALATLCLMGEHAYVIVTHQRSLGGFTTLGFAGLGLFITSFVIYLLSARLRHQQAKVSEQRLDISNLNQVNEYIVEQLDAGIVVIDEGKRIRIVNRQARSLLGWQGGSLVGSPLRSLSTDLDQLLPASGDAPNGQPARVELNTDKTLVVRLAPLADGSRSPGTILILEDLGAIEEEKQNEKLIAMGRLSASIAHEIRNPLGAISHAGQLLSESEHIDAKDQRLLEIISTQSQRINKIIENVLDLGRPAQVNMRAIDTVAWLDEILVEFRQQHDLSNAQVRLTTNGKPKAYGDPEQLRLAIINLLDNGLRHATPGVLPLLELQLSEDESDASPLLRIYDSGPGVDKTLRERIFEPFYTTSTRGNGLGLYVTRKICQANHASIDYQQDANNHGHFVIRLMPANGQAGQATRGKRP